MTPSFIKYPKAMQPRHTAKTLSRNAATTNAAMTDCDAPYAPATYNTEAVMVNAAPTPCANRFGGPGTSRC